MSEEEPMSLREFERAISYYTFGEDVTKISPADVNPKYRKVLIDSFRKVAEQINPDLARGVASGALYITKEYGMETYQTVVDSVCKVAKTDYLTALVLAQNSYGILIHIGVDGYKRLFKFMDKIAESDKDRSLQLANCSDTELFNIDQMGKIGYVPTIFDAMDKVIDKDVDLTHRVYINSPKILNEAKIEVDADYLLIESIENTKDAQLVSQLINMDKYKDAYNEKVAGFY